MTLKAYSRINLLMKNLSRRIAEVREEEGFTQDELSEMMGVQVRALQYWEAGRPISLRYLLRLSILLGRHPADFFQKPSTEKPQRGRPPKRRLPARLTNRPRRLKRLGQAPGTAERTPGPLGLIRNDGSGPTPGKSKA